MKRSIKSYTLTSAKSIALIGIMAATVECGKLALSFIPNVEVVSFLLALYSYVFGWQGVIASVVFVCIEPLIWGFGTWMVTYFIYWPSLAIVFLLLGRAKIGSRWILTGIAVLATWFFGVLSSLADVLILTGITPYFFKNFALFYVRGIVFYVIQISCNAVLFFTMFEFFKSKLGIIKRRMSL